MSDWTLCIDFGTAYSKAAAAPVGAWSHFDPATVRPLMLSADGQGNAFLLDSAVFVDDGRVLFGRNAIDRADDFAGKKRIALRSFKTLLSVNDLDRALNTNAPLTIDPHRQFQMRDLTVLYLAYLLASIERAMAADPYLSQADSIQRRYAAPAWRSGDIAGIHEPITQLFGEAEAFRIIAGDKLLHPDGMTVTSIASTMTKAIKTAQPADMGLIFEATAAAAYTSIGLEKSASHMIVVDMGAGTTDIAAVARLNQRTVELPEARITLKQAGDFIDRIIANRVIDTAYVAPSIKQQAELWAVLMRQMRDIKETLFVEGRATLRHDGKVVTLTMRDLERDKGFKAFAKDLTDAYDHSLAVVRDDAAARKRHDIEAIAVGGGAAAPFIQDLLHRKSKRMGKAKVTPRPATPHWAHAREFRGNLVPVFPQLAIAIGGAVAPEGMLAARSALSPVGGGRSDIPAGRD
jgi:molecular chaperone DnaK